MPLVLDPPPKDYAILIPTYNRVDTFAKKTYAKLLTRYGLCDKTYLCLQTDADEASYTQAFPDVHVVRTLKGLLATVNELATQLPPNLRVVVMHDDITRFLRIEPPASTRITVDDLDAVFRETFETMATHGCHLGGFYPTDNPMNMVRQPAVSTDLRFIHDPITLMRVQPIVLSPHFSDKMDFERTILYYQQDGGVVRMNHYTFCTQYNPKSATGGYGHRTADAEAAVTQRFVKAYAPYIQRVIVHKSGSTSLVLKKDACATGGETVTKAASTRKRRRSGAAMKGGVTRRRR